MQLILVINRRTRIEYYANKFSTLIPIKLLGLIVQGLCFLGVNVFAIECIQVFDCKFAWVSELKNSDLPVGTGSMFSSHLSAPWPGQAASRFIIDTELRTS